MRIKMALSVASILVTQNLLLANETTKLDDVQVVTSATGFEQNIKDAPATISVITAEELEKKSYSDVTDALKNVPGVNIVGSGSKKTISIRGMGSAYTLFLIDGKPAQGADAYAIRGGYPETQVNYMPPLEAIERIEIIRGPASSLYGSDAMGGVINIITKKHSDKATASIRTEYIKGASSNIVNNSTSNTSMFVNVPLIEKTLSFQLDAGLMDQKEKDNAGYTTQLLGADPDFERKNVGTKLIFTPDEHNTISAGYSYNLQESTNNPGKSMSEGTLNAMGVFTPRTVSNTKFERTNINVDHQLKYDKFALNSYVSRDKDKSISQNNEFETITGNTQGTYFFDNNSLSIGLNYKEEKISTAGTHNAGGLSKESERYQWALFAEDTWQATDDLALTISGRYDENEVFGNNFSPKAYAVYSLTDNLNLKGGVTSGYKAPSLRQSDPSYAEASMGGAMIGNADLKPEKSVNYEAGIAYDNPDIGLAASLMLFQTDFKNKIQRDQNNKLPGSTLPGDFTWNGNTFPNGGTAGYTTYYNVDEAESKGVEITTEYDILENLKYRQSYTFNDTEITKGSRKGEAFTDSPKHMFNAGLDWDVTSKLLLWTQVNYNGETGGSPAGQQGSLGLKKKPYTLVDLGGVYNFDKKLQFSAGVYNIANKQNEDPYQSDLNRTDQRSIDGRRFSVAMNMKF
ncbi:TonB-dependent receptor [Aliarcobacter cryaerophilus]|uniref:TonB-dependent receptor domain-containing protein n=1 Tax=Aliarcobacter cryaerophilus TaxID=28198 RepID=UPI0021B61934|nr:TonB-dependent receptor [Aliarcobacter cryaerophilus]MCT7485474.1 TonB-dependent receptor [Aliarcobacter cryaerophilus]MCT7491207.1 TonB-dependent receptor [Aliarcobacter cryaerophilus]